MISKNLIDYLVTHNGKPKDTSWYEVGEMFNLKPSDKKRAKKDDKYRKESIAKQANDTWRRYLTQKNGLELTKEIYENGEVKWETFKKTPEDKEVDLEGMELERVTTNPHGGAWLKYKKKEQMYDDIHIHQLKDLLTKEIKPLLIARPDVASNDKGLFIHGSDKHIGALTKLNSVYTNKYDREEMMRRLVFLVLEEIEEQVSVFGVFHSLFIMDYGDALDGLDGKTTRGLKGASHHDLPQQCNNREQHDLYVEFHRYLFDEIVLRKFALNIYFIATSCSNHGGDFEYGAMRNLETYLNVKYPDIKTKVSATPFNHFIYGKHCVIFGHGKDDEDMRAGMPLNLNDKVENYIADYIRVNQLERYNISFITGDLHQSSENYGKNFRYKKVLSQFGSTKWMHSNFGSGTPGLSIEVFYKDTPRIIKTDVFYNIEEQSNTGLEF